ncbi:hypothetical protein C4580_06120 [Candidatus Woesearchaeota archaeon]|nr:MAG: hypothetical protein C4580_06120 [Candidatus Woesearchaeota archaeon]
MRIPKRYGESQVAKCLFCEMQATTTNGQAVPVCKNHAARELPALKCACGSFVDIRKGKFGPFCTCFNCGAVNLRKILEVNGL